MATINKGSGRLAAPQGALWIGLAGLILVTIAGVLLVHFSDWNSSTFELDRWLFSFATPLQYNVAMVLNSIDKPVIVAAILLVGGVIFTFWRGWLPAIGFMLVAGFGWLLIAGVKAVVNAPRPTTFFADLQENTWSYPSGHVTFIMALTVAIGAVLYGSKWRWPLVIVFALLTLVTAWSRLYLGVHYPGDVAAGIVGGFSSTILCIAIWNMIFNRKRGRRSA